MAECEGRLVGAVLYQRRGEAIYLGRLSVAPDCRGQGIASALLAHVERHARGLGAMAVTLGVRIALPQNQRFFAQYGYREIGRDAHAGFEDPTSIRLEKRLDPR